MALARVKYGNTYGQHRAGELVEVDELEFRIVPHCLERVEEEAEPVAYEPEPVDDAPLNTLQDVGLDEGSGAEPPADEEQPSQPEPVAATADEVRALREQRKAEAKARKAAKAAASARQNG